MSEPLRFDEQGAIAQVREGMSVQDSDTQVLGRVAEVHLGDPGAVTTGGHRARPEPGVLGTFANAWSAVDDLPDPAREQLQRIGYLRIDPRGLFTTNLFASSAQVSGVTGGVVRLNVPRSQLFS